MFHRRSTASLVGISRFSAQQMYSVMQEFVFPFIKNLHADKNSGYYKYMGDMILKIPPLLLLSKVVDALDDIYTQMSAVKDADVRGDIYKHLLEKLKSAGMKGQFTTPRPIIQMMGTWYSCAPTT